ncbi:MAG TPA: hypothetical protein VI136_10400 [Verrucomicrobiae bacterium]
MKMRTMTRMLALVTALGCLTWWLAAGANRGWTKTSVPVKTVDAITGLESVSYERRFLPGAEFLGGGLLAAGALAGVSFLFRRSGNPLNSSPSNP